MKEKDLVGYIIKQLEEIFKTPKPERVELVKKLRVFLVKDIVMGMYSKELQHIIAQILVANEYGDWHHQDEIYDELMQKSLKELKTF